METDLKMLSGQDKDELIALIQIFCTVFEMETLKIPDDDYLKSLLNNPDFIVVVAKLDNVVVGGITAYILHRYYSKRPIVYIYDLGVLPDYQRKGIGKKLIFYLNEYSKENQFEEVYVEADIEDTYAVDFYRTTPISKEAKVLHFTYSLDKN